MRLADIELTPILDSLQLLKITDEEYFSDKYKHYISNSRLGLLNPKLNSLNTPLLTKE